ncbi:MAG: DsbA family protein [bacterium]
METETNSNSASKVNYSTPVAIVLAGLIIAGAMFLTDSKKAVVPEKVDLIKQVNIEGSPFIGNPNAKVVIVEWSDYQCPACQYADQNFVTPLVADYINAGKVKLVFKDFAFLGPDSQAIALTARAVWEAYPDKFYQWHKIFFDNQGKENSGWATKAKIASLNAKVAGLDQKVIDNLIAKNSAIYQVAIDADRAEGANLGVNATPSFIMGDKLQVGVPQYSVFKSAIDLLLK